MLAVFTGQKVRVTVVGYALPCNFYKCIKESIKEAKTFTQKFISKNQLIYTYKESQQKFTKINQDCQAEESYEKQRNL